MPGSICRRYAGETDAGAGVYQQLESGAFTGDMKNFTEKDINLLKLIRDRECKYNMKTTIPLNYRILVELEDLGLIKLNYSHLWILTFAGHVALASQDKNETPT